METGARTLMWLRNAVLAVFVAALLAGLFLPIYTDEVGWRLQERAGFDGVDKLFAELCGPNTLARPPFWMMPARWYSALFNSLFADPLYVRLSGILYGLVWASMLLALVRRATSAARDRVTLSTLAIGLMSLGTMPLLLIVSRPEQPILLAYTGAILIALDGWKAGSPTDARTAWLRSSAILLLALVAMSYHVKGVATAPLFLVCLALATSGSRAIIPRLVTAAALVVAAGWAAHYWINRFACPNDLLVRADYVRNTGAALVSATDGSQRLAVLGKALGNLSIYLFPGLPAPRPEPMSAWLPMHRISQGQSFTWFLVLVFIWTVVLIAAAWYLLIAARRAWHERNLDARPVLAVALFGTVLGWSATGFVSVYEAPFMVPMMVFAVVLALSANDGDSGFKKAIGMAAASIGVVGVVSIALVAMLYGPPLAAATHERGYISGQPGSISVFGYGRLRRDILTAARKCGIANPATRRALLIDDLTYFTFMRSRMPEHRGGLFNPVVTSEPISYLRSIRSDGLVVSCSVLPAALHARAKRQGQFCCLAPPNW